VEGVGCPSATPKSELQKSTRFVEIIQSTILRDLLLSGNKTKPAL